MSNLWPRVTTQEPCPICGRPDWCAFGDRAVKCMRVPSTVPSNDGGWYHFYEDTKYVPPPLRPKTHESFPPSIDAEALMLKWRSETKAFQFNTLAEELGVLPQGLMAIGAAWAEPHKAWAFPMYNGDGKTVGIRLRNRQGFKWAVAGSRQGIFLPGAVMRLDKVAFLPEGPTDCAAGLSIGLYCIGRPSCSTGAQQIKQSLSRIGIHKAVIIADNDDMKKLGPREGRPGIEGAQRLKKDLGIPSVIWIPPTPCKDIREFVRRGGTRQLIESEINQKIWTRK